MLKILTLTLASGLLASTQVAAQEIKQPPTAPPQNHNDAALRIAEDGTLPRTASWEKPVQGSKLARGV
jgi:hypothetical protein